MKHDHAIVYRGNDKTVILTREDFENEEEFEKWRLWMRENTSDKKDGQIGSLVGGYEPCG
ncbi:MAG: hypothetical protein SPG80_04905 [Candidatus Ventricola sp.]|nr:hypothetical protein [Candidatus Ventricola sp.]